MTRLFIYLFIWYVGPLFPPGLLIVKREELRVSHFEISSHWKRTLKIIFKGSGCFQFPEAVFTSTAKKAYALQNGDHYRMGITTSSSCVIRAEQPVQL